MKSKYCPLRIYQIIFNNKEGLIDLLIIMKELKSFKVINMAEKK